MLVQTLPVPRPSELYRLGDSGACCVNSGLAGSYALFSYDLYLHLRDSTPEFTNLAAFQAHARTMTIGRTSRQGLVRAQRRDRQLDVRV